MSSNENKHKGRRIGLMATAVGVVSIVAMTGHYGASIVAESSAGRLASGSKIAVAKLVVEATTAFSAAWLDRVRLALGYQLVRQPSGGFVAAMAGAGEGLRLFRRVAARATDVPLRKEANYLALGVLNRMPLDGDLRAVAARHAYSLGKALETTDFDRAEKAAVFEELALHAARSGAEPLAISLAEQADANEPHDRAGQWSSRVRSVRVALALCAANSPRPFAREAKPFATEIGADYLRKNFDLAWDAGLVMTVAQTDVSAQCKQLARDYARVARSATTT